MGHSLDKTGALLSYAKTQGLIELDGGRFKITRDGQNRIDKIAMSAAPKRKQPKRTRKKPAKPANVPARIEHKPNGANNTKPAALRALGDGLVENARRAIALLGRVLEDQLDESTPLIDAAFEGARDAVDLLAAGYRAAT